MGRRSGYPQSDRRGMSKRKATTESISHLQPGSPSRPARRMDWPAGAEGPHRQSARLARLHDPLRRRRTSARGGNTPMSRISSADCGAAWRGHRQAGASRRPSAADGARGGRRRALLLVRRREAVVTAPAFGPQARRRASIGRSRRAPMARRARSARASSRSSALRRAGWATADRRGDRSSLLGEDRAIFLEPQQP